MNLRDTFLGALVGAFISLAAVFGITEPERLPDFAPAANPCPAEFKHAPPNPEDHTVSDRCILGAIVVHLHPGTRFANYAIDTRAGSDTDGRYECRAIPGWPEDQCAPPD